MTINNIFNRLAQQLGETISIDGECLQVKPDVLLKTANCLRNDSALAFDYLDMITAADYNHGFELIYRFISLSHNQTLCIKTIVSKDDPSVDSLTPLWKGAELQEREIFDLFGIDFKGHPDLRRIMTWDGFNAHPLRKDYTYGT